MNNNIYTSKSEFYTLCQMQAVDIRYRYTIQHKEYKNTKQSVNST